MILSEIPGQGGRRGNRSTHHLRPANQEGILRRTAGDLPVRVPEPKRGKIKISIDFFENFRKSDTDFGVLPARS